MIPMIAMMTRKNGMSITVEGDLMNHFKVKTYQKRISIMTNKTMMMIRIDCNMRAENLMMTRIMMMTMMIMCSQVMKTKKLGQHHKTKIAKVNQFIILNSVNKNKKHRMPHLCLDSYFVMKS